MTAHQNNATNDKKLPPMVPGNVLFGNAFQLKKRPNDFLVDTVAKYGPIFRLKAPGVRVTVIAGPEGRDLIKHEGENGLHRQKLFNTFASEAGVDIFGVQGEPHERLRTLVKLGYSRQIPAQFTADMTRTVREVVKQWQAGQQLRLFDVMGDLTMSCVMDTVTPVPLRQLSQDFVRFGNDLMFVVTRGRPSFILWSPGYRQARRRVFHKLDDIIRRHRNGEFASDPKMYMIDAFIGSHTQHGDTMSDRDVRGGCIFGICGTQMYLGRLTGFMMYELLRDKTLMQKVRNEVDAAFSMGDLSPKLFRRMPYLRALYFETLRNYPLLPGLPYQAGRDIQVNEFTIPKGDLVLITPVPGHFSYDTYSNPHTFDVTRCMPPRNEHLNRGAFAPFGVGKRVCAGTGMCEIVTFTTVASVIREMDLKLEQPTYRIEVAPIPLIAPVDAVPVIVVGKRKPPTETTLSALLETSDLAKSVEKECGEEELPKIEPITLEAGHVIIRQGDVPDYFYILLEGNVSVIKADSAMNESRIVAELGPGQSFGEMGLLKNVPRQATVTANTRVRVLRLDRPTFEQLVVDSDLLGEELGAILQQRFMKNVLAQAMPRITHQSLEQYAAGIGRRSYDDGDSIIRQGDPAEEFFILAAGKVRVECEAADSQVEQLATLNPGNFFGEMGILNRQSRNATVKAIGAVEVLYLDRERFLEICKESSQVHEDVALTVCRRVFTNMVHDSH
jgi:CRP-like cAMP-binding protein/cytochrome P450